MGGRQPLLVVVGTEQFDESIEYGLFIATVDDDRDLVTVVDPLRDDGEDAGRVDG